jgi:hypothetical protein
MRMMLGAPRDAAAGERLARSLCRGWMCSGWGGLWMASLAPPPMFSSAASKARYRTCIYLVPLSLAAAYFLVWPIWRAQFLIEIWPTEAWNSYFQDAAAAGLPIYPPADGLVGNNYPPLSFYAIGLSGKLLGLDNLFAGRAASLIALVATAIEIFMCVRALAGCRMGAAIGALWYLAIMAHNSTKYIGANDPQLGGEAIMGAALVWFLLRDRAGQSPTPALLLMVVAGFWKHNVVAIPVAAIAWLFISGNRHALRATIIGAAACAVGIGACVVVFGPAFVPNLLANRQYAWSNVIGNIGHLQWSGLALLIWAGWAFSDRQTKAAKFTALHIACGLSACILQWFGHGVSGNAEFDLNLALGIGVGVAFTRIESSWLAQSIGVRRSRDVMIAALLLRLIVSDRQETALLVLSDEFRSSIYANQRFVQSEAAHVAAMSGEVACFNKVVCRLAGKPFVADEFKLEELVATGKATTAEIESMLAARHISSFADTGPAGADTSISRWWRRNR